MEEPTRDAQSANAPNRGSRKLVGLFLVLALLTTAWWLASRYISVEVLATKESQLRAYGEQHSVLVFVIAFVVYVVATGLSLPGAVILTLIIGWFFGFWRALLLVSFASTAGATVAFLLSRYLLSDFVRQRFGTQLEKFNSALEKEGVFYLFTLRLIPAVPFFVINVVMGLTSIRVRTYWWVSQIGMLAGTCVYVYAGTTVPSLQQLSDPSLMKSTDVVDWNEFRKLLVEAEPAKAPTAALILFEQLSNESQTRLRSSDFSSDSKSIAAVTHELNQLLQSPHLSLRTGWTNDSSSEHRATQLTAINRAALVYAFPQYVLPPQPILSKQLFFAFVLLGTFPLIIKRLLNRRANEEPTTL